MKTRLYCFTLIELLVTLALTTLVLGVIFSSLYQNATLKSRLEKAKEEVMNHARIQQQLSHVFATISEEKKTSLYTDDNGVLHFNFNNGIDPNPDFCERVSALIELENQKLFLTLLAGKNVRRKLLGSGIDAVSYEFLYNDEKEIKTASTWEKSHSDLPLYIQMTLSSSEKKNSYVFWINTPNEGVPLLP